MVSKEAFEKSGETESPEKLEMRFDPKTIEHLGVQMYYTLPPVIAEVIANAYDANAESVKIHLNDKDYKEIIIEDDGHGMSFNELNSKFLLIGRNRREEGELSPKPKERLVIGRKGLGKLSFFGVAKEITIETVKDNFKNSFSMNIEDIKKAKNGVYNPNIVERNVKVEKAHGTRIILRDLKRKSQFNTKDMAVSLTRSFSIFDEKDFDVRIIYGENTTITLQNDLKYEGINPLVELNAPFSDIENDYTNAGNINGKIVVAEDSTIPTTMRGIALFSRGKLVNDYSFYDVKATSHGYSYITGGLDISFIEEWDKDVISTNRRSLNWEDEDTENLKEYLNEIIRHVYNKQRELRKTNKKKKIKEKSGIDIDAWTESLPKHEKKLAVRLVENILNSEGLDDDKTADLVEYVKDSFQFESFKEIASDLEEIRELNGDELLALLREWKIIEAREFYKLSLVRIETIKKFELYINENVKEVPVMHDFLKSFGWLLDPRIIEFEDEKRFSQILRDKFPEKDIELESDKRIDFLCTTLANTLFIIELKRPKHVLKEKDILQANEYADFVEKNIGTDQYAPKKIITYIVCGERNSRGAVQKLVASLEQAGNIYIKTYSELLTNAQKYHKEFIKKYDDFKNKKESV